MAHKNNNRDYVRTGVPPVSVKGGVELKLSQGASIYINTGNGQNQGARPYQEDSFGYSNITDSNVVTGKGMFAILSDGMGGLSNGKSVADYVVSASIAMFEKVNPRADIPSQLKQIAGYINSEICKRYAGENGTSSAGATMVLAYIFKNRIYWLCIGDSRIYCLRNRHMLQMNEDHDYKNRLYRSYLDDGGSLSEIENDPQKDSLVCFVGKREIPYIDVSLRGFKIRPDDVFVLCSDGIYNAISCESMAEIIRGNDAQTASDKIVANVVNSRFPGQDNLTVMVIKCEKEG